MKELIEYLRITTEMMPNGLSALIAREGRAFEAAARPKGVRKQRNGLCFTNAFYLAEESKGRLVYVEGYAHRIIPTLHAWCSTPEGVVVDPTWKDPQEGSYWGIPMDLDFVKAMLVKHRVYGMLGNPEVASDMAAGRAKFRYKGAIADYKGEVPWKLL